MTNNEKGEKPHLTVVRDEYHGRLQQILATFKQREADKADLHVMDAISLLEPGRDNSIIRDWLDSHDHLTKARFDRGLAEAGKRRAVEEKLGFSPRTPREYIEGYAAKFDVTLTAQGLIQRKRIFSYEGVPIDEAAAQQGGMYAAAYDIASNSNNDLGSFLLELRSEAEEAKLGFTRHAIEDAMRVWAKALTQQAEVTMFLKVHHDPKLIARAERFWGIIEQACFDPSETAPGFATAVLKKFMWQVKRKARGMEVTNHLMPVITGAQGKGKSTLVLKLCSPLSDTMRSVDFKQIEEERNHEIWNAHILFLDEMGFASRANIDVVKNKITSPTISGKPLGTNTVATMTNKATFIGCTNKSLDQLIRDDTGVRRFAELTYSGTPDWEAMKKVDWEVLWQAIDEASEDPMAGPMATVLLEQQEANRLRSPVEVWARDNWGTYTSGATPAALHSAYREWEKESHPRADTNLDMFTKQLSNLIKTRPDFPWEKRRSANGQRYAGMPLP